MSDARTAADAEARQLIQLKRSGRDPDRLRSVLAGWLAPRLGAARIELSAITAPGGTGVANETMIFDARWSVGGVEHERGFVVRVATDSPLYLDADIRVHHDMYAALADAPGVPVPAVYGYEADRDVLGAPFFVMERIDGLVPADQPHWAEAGFVIDASPEERRAMWDNAVAVLAALHQVDEKRFGFLAPAAGNSGLADHLGYWRRWLDEWCDGPPHDTIEAGYEWLVAHLPEPQPTALSWGDSRFANIMFADTAEKTWEVAAIFDWDTVSLSGPGADLGWWRFMDGPASALSGIGTADELVQRWESLTGRTATDIEFYDVFTTFRLSAILLRLFGQMGASGAIPPEVAEQQARHSAAVQALEAQLAELR
jgi:aminoglycoside phosphotransferase (APT) family kinase protein